MPRPRKLKVYTIDGAVFHGAKPDAVIAAFRADSFNPEATAGDYILETALAAARQTGKPHRGTSAAELLCDLVESGLIRIEFTSKPEPRA